MSASYRNCGHETEGRVAGMADAGKVMDQSLRGARLSLSCDSVIYNGWLITGVPRYR